MRLKGKVTIITGGGTGIGKGVSERLAREGAVLVLVGVDEIESAENQYESKYIGGYTAAKDVAEVLRDAGFQATAMEADITKEDQVIRMVSETVREFGSVDILVNCAGVVSMKTIEELSVSDWDMVMDVNLKGTFITSKSVVGQMKRQGGGKIINFSSDSGKKGKARLVHYCASKWGVIGFTKALAVELARDGITVNSICPGIVGTQMWKNLSNRLAENGETDEESFKRKIEAAIPQGVPQTPEDMAGAVVFLATADHVTGIALSVDGGSNL